jgi:hypothetical protein
MGVIRMPPFLRLTAPNFLQNKESKVRNNNFPSLLKPSNTENTANFHYSSLTLNTKQQGNLPFMLLLLLV